jgi:hypothetical protein
MTRLLPGLIVWTAAALLAAGPAAAQPADASDPAIRGGWTFVPTLGYSQAWDDNVLMVVNQPNVPSDTVSVISPQGSLEYHGATNIFSANYNGAFELYRQFDALNSYGQNAGLQERKHLSARLMLFTQAAFSAMPTTELPLVAGVPYLRIGSRLFDVREGVEYALTKYTTIALSYQFEWIQFNPDPIVGRVLLGGHEHGGAASVRHQVSQRTAFIANYDLERANIVDGSSFTVQNALGGIEHRFTRTLKASAEYGIAMLDTSQFATRRTASAWQFAASQQLAKTMFDVVYARSFVPAFSGGATLQDDDFTSKLTVPFGRRVFVSGYFDRRQDTPLSREAALPSIIATDAIQFGATVGYHVSPWLRVEGSYGALRQTTDRPGGHIDQNRFAIQFVTTKPMRID